MLHGHTRGLRPPPYLRVEERAADAVAALTLYADIPSARRTFWRKARCAKEQPSPFTRVFGYLAELWRCNAPEASFRRFENAVRAYIDDLFTGAQRPRVDVAAQARELELEAAENRWALRYAQGERSVEVLRGYADALAEETAQQQVMERALRFDLRAMGVS